MPSAHEHFATHPNDAQHYQCEGVRIIPIGRNCVVRADDGRIGRSPKPYSKLLRLDEAYWYTVDDIKMRANVPAEEVRRRLKERWSFAELIKPDNWSRLIEARRNGIPQHNGQRLTIPQVMELMGISRYGVEQRILAGWSWADVVQPGRLVRREVPEGARLPEAAPGRASKATYVRRPFVYNGHLDTLSGHARAAGLNYPVVYQRLRAGLTMEQALQPGRRPRSDKGKPNPRRGKW